jgi:hypothetical protein
MDAGCGSDWRVRTSTTRGIVPGSGVGEGNLKDIFGFYCDQERH